jgi:hypothetical protein
MKKFFTMVGLIGLSTVAAFATPGCTGSGSPALTLNGPVINGQTVTDNTDTCTLSDGQVFSNFAFYANSGFTTSTPFSVTVTVSNNTLNFGTTNMAGTGEDIQVLFQTTPGVTGVNLDTGGADSVTEIVCGTAFAPGSETCPGTNLNTSVLSSFNGTSANSQITPVTTDFFLKDDSGGSFFSQTFAPEPMTMSMMGVGLLGLGILGRRRVRK